MFNTATPKWLLAAGLVGLVAAPGALAQSTSRAAGLSATPLPSLPAATKPVQGSSYASAYRQAPCSTDQLFRPDIPLQNAYGQGDTSLDDGTAQELGQSFTVPCDGALTRFDFSYFISDDTRAGEEVDLELTIYAGEGTATAPVVTVQETITLAPSATQVVFIPIAFDSVFVSEGDVYTAFLNNIDTGDITLVGNAPATTPNPYTGGAAYASTSGGPSGASSVSTIDLAFRALFQPVGPPPPNGGGELITLETDDASLGVYSDARIGTNGGPDYTGPGFIFGDAQADGTALFSSVFVAGVSGTQLSGTSYDADSDWIAESDFEPIDVPAGFDSAFESVITDANAENPLGLRVAQRAYSLSSDDDVSAGFVLEYVIENASSEQIDDLYAGIFADWDVGDFMQNLADFYDGTGVGLNYVYETTGPVNTNYYGVAALNEDVSGYAFDQEAGNDSPEGEVEIFEGLSQTNAAPTAPGDRRTTTGVGPYDLAPGEFVGVRFALVGGTDAADIQANAEALAAAVADLAFAPVPAAPPIDAVFDNGVISFEALGNGYFGAGQDVGGAGFSFDGANGLFEGQFLVGLSADNVVGAPYNPGEYEVVEALRFADVPPGFQNSTQAVFASADGAVEVTERVFVPSNFPFVILRYTVQNTSGGPLSGVHVGPFADFDLGSAIANIGGYDAANRLVYVSDAAVGDDTDFFGITSRTANAGVSGWSVSTVTTDAGLYASLSTPGTMGEAPDDRRVVLGNGPYNLVDGQSITVEYGLVAGETLTSLQAAAIQAQTAPLPTASEEVAEELELAKTGLRVFPNPVASSATVAFRAPAGADARVVVYDVLGREVLRVADQMATDLEQQVSFSTTSLPAGLYLVRLTAAGTSAVQQITVVR